MFWKFFLGFSQRIITIPYNNNLCSPAQAGAQVGSFQGHLRGSHQRALSQGTTRGARPHSSAACWLNFSGNLDAMHTFPFFVGRRDESRFSEVCSARGFRPHQLPRSRKLQLQLVRARPRILASAEPGWLRWGLRTSGHTLSLGAVPRSKGKPGKA